MLRIDHVIVAVTDLDAAARRFHDELGLGSLPGGRHPGWGTGNRIVPLADAYVELLGVVDADEALANDFGRFIASAVAEGDRLLAWCVASDDLERVSERLGLPVTPGARVRPDGRHLRWRTAGLPMQLRHPALPFFIKWHPESPHPGAEPASHTASPKGIEWIELAIEPALLQEWLGGEDLPVRAVEGPPGVRAVGIATPSGTLVLR